jgi:hypothetical protein
MRFDLTELEGAEITCDVDDDTILVRLSGDVVVEIIEQEDLGLNGAGPTTTCESTASSQRRSSSAPIAGCSRRPRRASRSSARSRLSESKWVESWVESWRWRAQIGKEKARVCGPFLSSGGRI